MEKLLERLTEKGRVGVDPNAEKGVTNVFNIEGIISSDNLDTVLEQLNNKTGFSEGSAQK